MTVEATQSRSEVDEASSATFGVPRVASEYGSVFLDVTLDSNIDDPERTEIRNKFDTVVTKLTGHNLGDPLKPLAGYMFEGLTTDAGEMPSHGTTMQIKLNGPKDGYLLKIVNSTHLGQNATLDQYDAVLDRTGKDLYCIGTDGLRWCYHFFELVPKQGSSAGSINLPHGAKFRLCCVGKFD